MPRRPKLAHRRRTALAILGFLHVGMGVSLWMRPPDVFDPAMAILHHYIPHTGRVALWLTAGLTMAALALSRHAKAESIGWFVALVMPVERAVSYGWSSLMWMIPGYPPGALASLGSGLVWTAVVIIVWLIASWPEETLHPPRKA